MQRYARVITDDPTDKELDYSIPPAWAGKVQIGSRVKVPLRSREILATVVALVDTPSVPKAKNISALISESPVLNNSLLTLARWMANYYCCPVESAVRSLLPEVIRTAKLGFKQERVVSATREISETELGDFQKKAPRQAHVLRAAIEVGVPIRWRELQQNAGTTDRTIQQLVDRGLLRVDLERSERDPYANESFIPSTPMALNPDQKRALDLVVQSVDARDYRRYFSMELLGAVKRRSICRPSIIA